MSEPRFQLILIDQIRIKFSDKDGDGVNLDSLDTWDNTRRRKIARPIGSPGTVMAKILKSWVRRVNTLGVIFEPQVKYDRSGHT